jgi:hypothetical protein
MSKDTKSKKLLLGSVLTGLMVVAPGIAVTTAPISGSGAKFFQTAQLKTGYGLAQAGEGPADTGDKGTEEQDVEKKEEKKEATPKPTPKASPSADNSAKTEGSKSCSAKGCGAGACG